MLTLTHVSPLSLVLSVLWLVAMNLAAWNIGRVVVARSLPRRSGAQGPASDDNGLERLAFALVVGLTVMGTGSLLLAIAHGLHPLALVIVIGALAVHAVVRLGRGLRGEPQPRVLWPHLRSLHPMTAVAIAALLCFVPLCLIPAVPHDSVVYHLALPAEYLRHHALVTYPYSLNANMPHNVELLFAPAMAGGGAVTATLLMFEFSGLVMVGLARACSRLGMAHLSGMVCLLFLASPIVQWHLPITYIEPAIACVLLYSLLLLLRWRREGLDAQLVVACWLCGWAMGCKYTVWYMSAGIPLSIVFMLIGRRERLRAAGHRLWPRLLVAASMLAAPVLPWLVRQWVVTGDPLYPNLRGLLGTRWWSPVLQMQTTRKFTFIPILRSLGWLATFVRRPWDLVNNPQYYLADAYSGLVMLLFLAAALLPSSYRGSRKYVLLSAFVGYLSWALVPVPANEGRYLVAVLPVMVLAAALVLERICRRPSRRTLAFVVVGAAWVYTFSIPKLPFEEIARLGVDESFRNRNISFPMNETLNRELPADAKVLFMFDNRTLGLERERSVETLYEAPSSLELIRGSANAAEAGDRLRRLGFTHVVMNWGQANFSYFNNPDGVTDPQILPRAQFDEEKRIVEELLQQRTPKMLDVGPWTVYRLVQ